MLIHHNFYFTIKRRGHVKVVQHLNDVFAREIKVFQGFRGYLDFEVLLESQETLGQRDHGAPKVKKESQVNGVLKGQKGIEVNMVYLDSEEHREYR